MSCCYKEKEGNREAALAAISGHMQRQLNLVSAQVQTRLLLDRVAVLVLGWMRQQEGEDERRKVR